jgi:hypothetical protein
MSKVKSVVGDLINFRGLVYSPMNENGVIFLFGKVVQDLNMYVEEIKPGFPDCIGRRFTGMGWERVTIEFEFKSSSFQTHKHDSKECDIIVCWKHDWPDCPLEVIELQEVIKSLPNPPLERPDKGQEETALTLEDYFESKKTNPEIQALYRKLIDSLPGISEKIWIKIGDRVITFYSPERVFAYTRTRKATAPLQFFTGSDPIPGISKFGYAGRGEKWGKFIMRNEADLQTAIAAAKESYQRIQAAIKKNEPTGWFATLEEEEADEEDPSAQ